MRRNTDNTTNGREPRGFADLAVTVTRYLDADPQPGILEFAIDDCYGKRWLFVEKTAMISDHWLMPDDHYPCQSSIQVWVCGGGPSIDARECCEIEAYWGFQSIENDVSRFRVFMTS